MFDGMMVNGYSKLKSAFHTYADDVNYKKYEAENRQTDNQWLAIIPENYYFLGV